MMYKNQIMDDIGWTVSCRDVNFDGDYENMPILGKKAVVNDKTNRCLGIVGMKYRPVQNYVLLDIADGVSSVLGLKTNSIISMKGGERVTIVLEGETKSVGRNDTYMDYFVLTNGHDGVNPLCAFPTSYRIYCENTLNMAINSASKAGAIKSFWHTDSISKCKESIINACKEYNRICYEFDGNVKNLAAVEFGHKQLNEFFLDVAMNNPIIHPYRDRTIEDETERALFSWLSRFDEESGILGSNLWVATNAVLWWIDKNKRYHKKNERDNRINNELFGDNAKTKRSIMEYVGKNYG